MSAGGPAGTERARNEKMLLFFDIDGTIFDDNRRLPDSVLPAMEAARRNGHRLIINTGRTLCNLDHRLDDFPLDGWIMGCGTRIIYHGKTLQSMEYDPERSHRLRHVFLELGISVVYECDTALYFDPEGLPHPSIVGFREWALRHGLDRDISADDPEFRAVKMFCFASDKLINELERRSAEIGMPYSAIRRGDCVWEVVPSGMSKGKGIVFLRERLGESRENCYAFGDSENDLSMFEHAGHSIAMGNASESVKAVCTYVTDRPEDHGIRNAMIHFGLV